MLSCCRRRNVCTSAGLRGIDSVDRTAGATGTGGTVLRTTDGGAHWIRCATPRAPPGSSSLVALAATTPNQTTAPEQLASLKPAQ